MSLYLISLMSLKLMSLSIHVPVFEVSGVPQIDAPFNLKSHFYDWLNDTILINL